MSDKTVTYSFGILTNDYVGNFHREITCYITGCGDDSLYCEDEMVSAFEQDATKEELSMFGDMEFLDYRPVDDYGLRNNVGYGEPPYNVEIFIVADAVIEDGPKIWTMMAKRARQFLDLPHTKKHFPKLQILGFEIIKHTLKTERTPFDCGAT